MRGFIVYDENDAVEHFKTIKHEAKELMHDLVEPEGRDSLHAYLKEHGNHCSKKLCDFLCNTIYRYDYSKDKIELLMRLYDVSLPNSKGYDSVLLANWCKFMFGSCITDDKSLLLHVKSLLDKESELIFDKLCAEITKRNLHINWQDMI